MYINKCTKCGAEFETKNPKRVICPNCLYPDRKPGLKPDSEDQNSERQPLRSSYSTPGDVGQERRPYRNYNSPSYSQGDRPQRPYNNYNRNDNRQGGYNRPDRPYNNYNRDRNDRGGDRPYNNYNRNDNRQGGYNKLDRPYNNRPGGFNNNRPPQRRGGLQRPKQLLVSKEQIAQIELLYKKTLPLPNPDIHEVIGNAIGLEPRKVFFGINLVRQKMMLPKLPFPKRKLAVSPDQLFAIKNLYEPLLPLPPIGCHKIIAAQLKMDEWRVHVGIGLVRKQIGLERWNPDRPDAPEEYKTKK